MFEELTDIERIRKVVRGNGGGTGVAVWCPGEETRKFKIRRLDVHMEADSARIVGVELDMPKSIAMSLEALKDARLDGETYWVKPEKVYRNKGDCARAVAKERIHHVKEKVKREIEKIDSLDSSLSGLKTELDYQQNRLDRMMAGYNGKKWFRGKQ